MCGIAGLVSLTGRALPNDAEQRVTRMTSLLEHRGPDDSGLFVAHDRLAVLGHRRLSIIDPTPEAHQPMVSLEGNAITFNGEVYNFRELATTHAVGPSASDTAILLRLLERRGVSVLPEIHGFFSFAYWDAASRSLIIARDRFGKKPVYYYTNGDWLIFASELGALLGSGLVPRHISIDGVAQYFRYYCLPHPATPIEGVLCLPPASVLRIDARTGWVDEPERWWTLPSTSTLSCSYGEAVLGVRERLERSVCFRMVSDVAVGAFLSGGLDSNAIVGLMARESSHLKTFTIGFEGFQGNETELARIGAAHFKTDHHEHVYTDEEVAELLPHFFASMDSPTGDGLNSFLVSHFTREADPELKVIVTGTGGDELFLGYKKYRWMAQHPIARKIAKHAPAKEALTRWLGTKNLPAASLAKALLAADQIRQLFSDDETAVLLHGPTRPTGPIRPTDPIRSTDLESLLAFDIEHYLPDMLLRDMDVFTMAHSFEARVPLLDGDLVEYVWQLPMEYKSRGATKQLLIDATGDILPPALLTKPKTGFELPLAGWLKRGTLHPWLERIRTGELALIRDNILSGEAIRNIHTDFVNGKSHYLKPWSVIALDEWYRHAMQEDGE